MCDRRNVLHVPNLQSKISHSIKCLDPILLAKMFLEQMVTMVVVRQHYEYVYVRVPGQDGNRHSLFLALYV